MPDRILEITRNSDRLFAQVIAVGGKPIAGPIFEMFAEGESIFFVKVTGSRITFETGPDGRATSLIMHRAGRSPLRRPIVLIPGSIRDCQRRRCSTKPSPGASWCGGKEGVSAELTAAGVTRVQTAQLLLSRMEVWSPMLILGGAGMSS